MIIWFNCKITDQRLNPHTVVRYNLRNDNRFDIARYSFASFVPIEPLVTKFIFNLELADEHQGREPEMEAWLRGLFPEHKLDLRWHRCNTVAEWKGISDEMQALGENLIFPAGNEDHIFLDSSVEVFRRGLELIEADPNPLATLMTSHWPESIRAASYFNGTVNEDGNYVSYEMVNNDAIRVMKKEYFDWYVESAANFTGTLFRTEHWNQIGIHQNKLYVPTKEQFRHFDGYAHVGVGPEVCPPLEIPAGFFEGMTVRYGFDDYEAGKVNINPLRELRTTVDNGVDYKYTLDTIPNFWQDHIAHKEVCEGLDQSKMNQAYDLHLLDMTRININWWHVNARFDDSNWPPAKWLNNHTKECLFYE